MGIEVCEALGASTGSRRNLWMYEVFYNFKAEPFRLSPDHKFCYEHKSYAKARAYMAYAFKRAEGFVMITGRPGTGKTTLIGELVESLSKDRVCTANLVCTQLQADDLLKTVAFSFGIGSTGVDKAEMLQRLTVLLHRWHREGRRALLIVDEAQDLSSSAMEELRLLTNIQIGGQPLLQIFLLGQSELRDLILSPAMEQVHQRIVAASHIEGLGVEETEAYVLHRLTVVGWRGDPAIDRAIFPLIHKFSEGVPRRINLICSRLFLLGSVEQRHDIRVADVRVVITELQAENLAAGTGISLQDFDEVSEPEWVPAPQTELHAPAAHRLHAVDNDRILPVNNAPVDSPIEAKKKDSPDLTSHPHPIPEEHSADLVVSSVYFQDEPDYDHDVESPSFADSVYTAADQSVQRTEERNFDPAPRGTIKATALTKRIIALGLAMVAVLSLILLTMYFSNRGLGSRSERNNVPSARVEQISNVPSSVRLPQDQNANTLSELEAVLEEEKSIYRAGNSEMTSPAMDDAEIPRPGSPDEFSELGSQRPSPDASPSDQRDLASTSSSSAEDSVALATATEGSGVESGSTISVNFPFDSDDLIPDSHLALDQAVEMLKENPESIAAITGFTDNRGNDDYNLVLSRKRAEAVKVYLVNAGIEQERLLVEGRGALTDFVGEHSSDSEDAMEPHRVVQITLSSDRSAMISSD